LAAAVGDFASKQSVIEVSMAFAYINNWAAKRWFHSPSRYEKFTSMHMLSIHTAHFLQAAPTLLQALSPIIIAAITGGAAIYIGKKITEKIAEKEIDVKNRQLDLAKKDGEIKESQYHLEIARSTEAAKQWSATTEIGILKEKLEAIRLRRVEFMQAANDIFTICHVPVMTPDLLQKCLEKTFVIQTSSFSHAFGMQDDLKLETIFFISERRASAQLWDALDRSKFNIHYFSNEMMDYATKKNLNPATPIPQTTYPPGSPNQVSLTYAYLASVRRLMEHLEALEVALIKDIDEKSSDVAGHPKQQK
jgi:hypothetical protein